MDERQPVDDVVDVDGVHADAGERLDAQLPAARLVELRAELRRVARPVDGAGHRDHDRRAALDPVERARWASCFDQSYVLRKPSAARSYLSSTTSPRVSPKTFTVETWTIHGTCTSHAASMTFSVPRMFVSYVASRSRDHLASAVA